MISLCLFSGLLDIFFSKVVKLFAVCSALGYSRVFTWGISGFLLVGVLKWEKVGFYLRYHNRVWDVNHRLFGPTPGKASGVPKPLT